VCDGPVLHKSYAVVVVVVVVDAIVTATATVCVCVSECVVFLLSNTKISKEHIQNIFNIDRSRNTT
jgi:hypothetical protein